MSEVKVDERPWYTPGELAKFYRVNPKTISRWADAGKLEVKRTKNGHRRVREKDDSGTESS